MPAERLGPERHDLESPSPESTDLEPQHPTSQHSAPSRSRVPWIASGVTTTIAAVVAIVVAVVTVVCRTEPLTAPLRSVALTARDLVPEYELHNTMTLAPDYGPLTQDVTACVKISDPPAGVVGRGAVGVHRDPKSQKSAAATSVMVFRPPTGWTPGITDAMAQACRKSFTPTDRSEVTTLRTDGLPDNTTAVYIAERHDGKASIKVAIRGIERGVGLVAIHASLEATEQSPQELAVPALTLYLAQRQRIRDAA